MPRQYQNILYVLPVTSFVAIFALLQITDPLSVGPAGILLVFVLIYIFFLSGIFILLHAGLGIISRFIGARRTVAPRVWSLGVKRSYYVASIVAFAPVCLLAIQSIGQLQLRDVALVGLLCSIAIFYVLKRG